MSNFVAKIRIHSFPRQCKLSLSVMQICSRTCDLPACVAPAKNNFVCVFIVKREKRMRDAGCSAGRYPAAEHPHA
jgi:hypothetical protein